MKRNWELDELIDHFTFLPNELTLIRNKTGNTRIGFVVMLSFSSMKQGFHIQKMKYQKQ